MFTGELAFLSNFDTTPFRVESLGCVVKSAEHAFNALKTLDPTERASVLVARSPAEAKRLGRRVTLRPGWDTGVRVGCMESILRQKFAPGSALAARLVALPQGMVLRETNLWGDQFWGDDLTPRYRATPGLNMLGELLMVRREVLRLSMG